jgi:RimJ/RimL family protein N-acetyltransferase
MKTYKCLQSQTFQNDKYSIVPIRDEDKYVIMQWRNEQIYHLRQDKPLTKEKQEAYFQSAVANLFEQDRPNQLLFSYLENDICIGYGGLVHINWIDKNAEISFIINTELEKDFFEFHWVTYLSLIEQVAFAELKFHKIFTFAFDLRPHLYEAVEKAGFIKEGVLKEHYYWNDSFIDAIIHTKINNFLSFRLASETDVMLYFDWANEEEVRKQSFQSNEISLETHKSWFLNKLNDPNCSFFIFENENKNALGQVRIQKEDDNKAVIGISIAKEYRRRGLANRFIELSSNHFLALNPDYTLFAYIKQNNVSSIKSFESSNFIFSRNLVYQDTESVLYTKKLYK